MAVRHTGSRPLTLGETQPQVHRQYRRASSRLRVPPSCSGNGPRIMTISEALQETGDHNSAQKWSCASAAFKSHKCTAGPRGAWEIAAVGERL
ncbi:hypothetical protein FKM82_023785 [Ascaphus truei]